MTNAYATGAVSGFDGAGGLIGDNRGTVSNAYATGTVSGESGSNYVGGLLLQRWQVTNAYATGTVSGYLAVGGLIGWNETGTVTNTYATGAVSGLANGWAG